MGRCPCLLRSMPDVASRFPGTPLGLVRRHDPRPVLARMDRAPHRTHRVPSPKAPSVAWRCHPRSRAYHFRRALDGRRVGLSQASRAHHLLCACWGALPGSSYQSMAPATPAGSAGGPDAVPLPPARLWAGGRGASPQQVLRAGRKVPLAFVFADTTTAEVAYTLAVLEEAGCHLVLLLVAVVEGPRPVPRWAWRGRARPRPPEPPQGRPPRSPRRGRPRRSGRCGSAHGARPGPRHAS